MIKTREADGMTYVSVKTVSETASLPYDVVIYNIEHIAARDGLKEGVDFRKLGLAWAVNRKGLLWIFAKTACSDFSGMNDLVCAMDRVKEKVVEVPAYRQEDFAEAVERINVLDKTIADLKNTLARIDASFKGQEPKKEAAVSVTGPEPAENKLHTSGRNDPALPALTKEEQAWTTGICKEIKEIVGIVREKEAEAYISVNRLLMVCYYIMRKNYGIVFEQEKKDVLEACGMPAETMITTLRVISYSGMLRSIMSGIVGTLRERALSDEPFCPKGEGWGYILRYAKEKKA